jgi:flagellar biosynthesis protein FlhB
MVDSSTEERTEAPTPRRIQQARRDGQTPISRDLVAALAAVTACIVFVASAQAGAAGLAHAMREAMAGATKSTGVVAAAKAGFEVALLTLALPASALFVIVCLAGLAHTQGFASAVPLRPDARRVVPSLGRVFGRERVIEVGKAGIVLCLLFSVALWSIRPAISSLAALSGASAARILHTAGVLGEHLAVRLSATMLALGAADFFWQRHRHEKALRMSRDEVKREQRESEGEPAQKAERLRRYQELMQEQRVGDIAAADFVVVQAGRMAVAIRYDHEAVSAPIVMVKGVHGQAQAIEAAARVAGVPVVVDPNLVMALASVEDGDDIPEVLYQQVAECLVRIQAASQPEN